MRSICPVAFPVQIPALVVESLTVKNDPAGHDVQSLEVPPMHELQEVSQGKHA